MTPNEIDAQSDHDLLICVDSRTQNIEKLLGNHLVHCDKREMIYLTVTLGSVATALLSIIFAIITTSPNGI